MIICDRKQCSGCGACKDICPQHCIDLLPDHVGFLFPHVDETNCIHCQLCQKTCPSVNPVALRTPGTVYAAWAKDETIRTSSSSGGIFSIFAEHVLSQGGSVNGVVFDKDLNLIHEMAYHSGASKRFRGSKYIQSNTNGVYSTIKDELNKNKQVLFTGTPCQVAGLRAFLKKNYDNLICCDIICHGVPSKKFLLSCLEKVCPIPLAKITLIQFRKLNGWGDLRLRVYGQDELSWQATSDRENAFITSFRYGAINNESCYHCRYACKDRVGDITLGDFWGIGVWKKFGHDTSLGCSTVLVNTEKGQEFFSRIKDELFFEKRYLREACRGNDQLRHPMMHVSERDLFEKEEWDSFIKRFEHGFQDKDEDIDKSIPNFYFQLLLRITRKVIRKVGIINI